MGGENEEREKRKRGRKGREEEKEEREKRKRGRKRREGEKWRDSLALAVRCISALLDKVTLIAIRRRCEAVQYFDFGVGLLG